MTIIGLTGLKGSGKDTAADALGDLGYARLAFADPLREMLYALNPFIGDPEGRPHSIRWQEYLDTVGYETAKKHHEVRRLMQVFGTEVMRHRYGQDVWVDLAERRMTQEGSEHWVLTDVRFDNEARMVHRLGGFIVRVERNGLSSDGHSSEAGVSEDLVDVLLPNNKDIEDLHIQVRSIHGVLTRLNRHDGKF